MTVLARSQRIASKNIQPTREPDLPLAFSSQNESRAADARHEPAIPLDEPPSDPNWPVWNLQIPVFQWEIDPTDTERHCGSAELRYLGWDFRMWWEKHPAGLVYASIQATQGGREGDWQGGWTFAPDRALAATLVYDDHRHGIVSIHGTAKNFRPFIEAFLLGFGLGPPAKSE